MEVWEDVGGGWGVGRGWKLGNLLPPAVTSSLCGTSITASNVSIRAAGCFNATRL